MAIPIAFLTAVIKKAQIEASYPGGVDQFVKDHAEAFGDEHLLALTFMSDGEIQALIDGLESKGFDVSSGLAIGEVFRGEWKPCQGIEFARAGSEGPFARWEARASA